VGVSRFSFIHRRAKPTLLLQKQDPRRRVARQPAPFTAASAVPLAAVEKVGYRVLALRIF
jgi:hypothetical protein